MPATKTPTTASRTTYPTTRGREAKKADALWCYVAGVHHCIAVHSAVAGALADAPAFSFSNSVSNRTRCS